MGTASYVINMPNFEELFEKLSGQNSNNISGLQKLESKRLPIPAVVGDYKIKWTFDEDIYITNVKYSQSGWRYEDYWDLKINDTLIFENVYTKEIAEDEIFRCFCFVPANTEITLILHNVSGNSRDIWADLLYISKKSIYFGGGINDIEHDYNWLIVLRWESNTDIDMDLHALLSPLNIDIGVGNKSYTIDENNKIWLDKDHLTGSHRDEKTKENKPEIITVLGRPCEAIKIYITNYNKISDGNSYKPELELKEPVTIEILKKDRKGNRILVNKFSVDGKCFTTENPSIDFCTINLDTGVVTKCNGVKEE